MRRWMRFALPICLAALVWGAAFARAEEETYSIFAQVGETEAAGEAPAAFLNDDPMPAAPPLLVNGDNLLDEGWTPEGLILMRDYCDPDLVYIRGSEIQGVQLAVDMLQMMLRVAQADGLYDWQISSGYRSVAYQQKMWDDKVYGYRQEGKTGSQARAAAGRYIARPGASEHHTGLAFDVTVRAQENFAATAQSRWLSENCWDYGFIIRYTEEKKGITGISAEPWHIRYVGQPHAGIMRDEGLCLEEYIEKYYGG